ncbi:MAG: hypothetical protein ABFD54_05910 [Armatimonadota bacterium]|nr:hypothetical protein [bacterium]
MPRKRAQLTPEYETIYSDMVITLKHTLKYIDAEDAEILRRLFRFAIERAAALPPCIKEKSQCADQ